MRVYPNATSIFTNVRRTDVQGITPWLGPIDARKL